MSNSIGLRKLVIPSITTLSLAQILGVGLSTVVGTGIWFFTAAIASPEDVGILGKVITTSTFIAGLVTAGLGQFILTTIRFATIAQLRRYLWLGTTIAGVVAGMVAILVGVIPSGKIDHIVIATGLLCFGIAITNLQDAFYLGTGLFYDVPFKSALLLLVRFVLLMGMLPIGKNIDILLLVFVSSQGITGTLWLLIRGPRALLHHANRTPETNAGIFQVNTFLVSYLYTMSVSAISMGVPALITTWSAPHTAGIFFLAWTIANLLSSISIAIGNSVLALSLGTTNIRKTLIRILGCLVLVLGLGGVFSLWGYQNIQPIFGSQYSGVFGYLKGLILAQVFFGITVVSLSAYRAIAMEKQLNAILVGWPLLIIFCVLFGVTTGGIESGIWWFVIGNVLTSLPICFITLTAVVRVKQA